jgi:hypothetical protein
VPLEQVEETIFPGHQRLKPAEHFQSRVFPE